MPNLPPEVAEIFKKIDSLLYSDDEQNKLIPAQIRPSIVGGVDCDVLPGALGAFGLIPANPIPTNGPIGEVLYLSRLRTQTGNPIMFHRVRAEEGPLGPVDAYEVLSIDGTVRQTLFLSMYHPRKSKCTPNAYTYAAEFDSSNFTYGVNHIVPHFPEKLDAYIRQWHVQALGMPLPVGTVRQVINGSRFKPSVLNEVERAPSDSPQGEIRDDILKLLHASRDPRFEGQSIAIGIDGIVRPMSHNPKHLEKGAIDLAEGIKSVDAYTESDLQLARKIESLVHLSDKPGHAEEAAALIAAHVRQAVAGASKQFVDASAILQRLYDSEINCEIFSEWDAGFFWSLGDSVNGYDESGGGSRSIAENAEDIAKAAVKRYPDSDFAKWYAERLR